MLYRALINTVFGPDGLLEVWKTSTDVPEADLDAHYLLFPLTSPVSSISDMLTENIQPINGRIGRYSSKAFSSSCIDFRG